MSVTLDGQGGSLVKMVSVTLKDEGDVSHAGWTRRISEEQGEEDVCHTGWTRRISGEDGVRHTKG